MRGHQVVKKVNKERLDVLLVQRNIVPSQKKAQSLVMAGKVQVNNNCITKPGTMIDPEAQIELIAPARFVSRGGEKLTSALEQWPIFQDFIIGKIALDLGASTGGFTDCLLKSGVAGVIAMDVGYGQLHSSLTNDPRVIVRDRINVRLLKRSDFADLPKIDFFTADLSFISLKQVAPAIADSIGLLPGLVMVKPQFELPQSMNVKGVVLEREYQKQALVETAAEFQQLGWQIICMVPSLLVGPKGNREFFLGLLPQQRKGNNQHEIFLSPNIELGALGQLVLSLDL